MWEHWYRQRLELLEKAIIKLHSPKVSLHHDADAISSLTLFTRVKEVVDWEFPDLFGYISKGFNVVLDQRPKEYHDDIELVIDHHLGHTTQNAGCFVFPSSYPTSRVLVEALWTQLQDTERWKAAIGIAGDGHASAIPPEILKQYPILMKRTGEYHRRFGRSWVSDYPILQTIAVGINSLCRMGKEEEAFYILESVDSPSQLLLDETLRKASEKMRDEEKKILKKLRFLRGDIASYASFSTKFPRILGRVASSLSNTIKGTIVLLETSSRKVSIRGINAKYLEDELKKTEVFEEIGGHPGFVAAVLKENKIKEFEGILSRYL